MTLSSTLELALLPGARELLDAHARELPQRDDLCGAFCGSLALAAAGLREGDGGTLDQDAVALAAGSVVAAAADPAMLPADEPGRRDYRLEIPRTDDAERSGTTARGVVAAIAELSGGALDAIPLRGPWSEHALAAVFDAAAASHSPATLIANLATHHLWGGRPNAAQLLDHLLTGSDSGPDPDWTVGHFVCVFARIGGPGGVLYALADTYPALGHAGVHLQPHTRLARAIERRDKPSGGMIAVVDRADAVAVRAAARSAGVEEGLWDNGTIEQERAA